MRRRHAVVLTGLIGLVLILGVWLLGGPLAPAQAGPPLQQGARPAPQVIDTQPLPGEEVPLDGAITFYFDRPMDLASVQAALSVSPATPLAVEALDPGTVQIRPEKPLLRATLYTFTLGADARSADGEPLGEPFTFSVQTVGYLAVAEVLPAPDTAHVATDSAITVIFNRPVVPLVTAEEMETLPDPLVFAPALEGEGEWLNT